MNLPRGGWNCISSLFSMDSAFTPFDLCLCPLSVSLVPINGNFQPFLASVISISAMRGRSTRTAAASRMVVTPKWFLRLPITSRPPFAPLETARHQCNAAVVGVRCCCSPVLSLDRSCRGVLAVTNPPAPAQRGREEAFMGLFRHLSCQDQLLSITNRELVRGRVREEPSPVGKMEFLP